MGVFILLGNLDSWSFAQEGADQRFKLKQIKEKRRQLAEAFKHQNIMMDRYATEGAKEINQLADRQEREKQRRKLFEDVNRRRRQYRKQLKIDLGKLFEEEMALRGKEILDEEPPIRAYSLKEESHEEDFEDLMENLDSVAEEQDTQGPAVLFPASSNPVTNENTKSDELNEKSSYLDSFGDNK
jgi:hypothetical protein